jgi:septal ring factor EnvC (AmiA/AmiB activator)
MKRLALLIASTPLLLAAASAPVADLREPVDIELKQAQAEARAAEAEVLRLEAAASRARGEAGKLAAERQASAAAIAESEARISAAEAALRLARARVAARAGQLARQQAPLAALLAGIVSMGRRPPLLSSADSRSLGEFVRVRVLLDTTLPVIRARSSELAAGLAESRRLEDAAARARNRLAEERKRLAARQQRFATLEAEASRKAARLGAGAVSASDVLTASSEGGARIRSQAERRRAELRLAAELGAVPPAMARPGKTDPARPPIAYRLPVAAPVVEGVGSVSETGIRARGIALQAYAGQEVLAPADGTIAFAGPFRRHDGVVIIDHGRGWMTLMTGVRSNLRKGERVTLGEPLGRALGPVNVELSANGMAVSAALIAGSSQLLFIKGKSG